MEEKNKAYATFEERDRIASLGGGIAKIDIQHESGKMTARERIDLLENDILDSLAFIELINALNDEFNIEIQPTQVKPTTWRTVKGIVQMVEKLQNEAE